MEQLSEDNFIYTSVESESSELVNWNTDSVVWTGNRWWLRDSTSDETPGLGYLVSSGANPLTSTWTLVNPLPAVLAAGLGESEEFYEDAGGTIYGTHWFAASNSSGQVVASSDGGQTWVTSVPKPYIGTVSSISNNVESTISFGESASPSMSQKIVISNAVPSSFNGTFYVNTDSSKLYTDVTLETHFDTSEMDEFVSATATLSKGQFIDGIGFGLGKFIAANDDEEIFVSTNLQTWTQVYNSIEGGDFVYWNDIDFNAEWEIASAGPSLGNFTISGSTMSSNEGITITNETNDSADLYIKAGDDLYLEAHDDDLFIRSADDVRIQTNYNFNDGIYQYQWEFTNNGDLRFPDNTVQTTALKNGTGTWALATGSNTFSFTVDWNNTYVMWVRGNVPNGIIAWNATVGVTNANVPVIGTQYAWNYNSGTTEAPVYVLALTSIPAQIIGTQGAISTALPAVGTTANTFEFTINNTSGAAQTVYWGWTKV
jgi:hypothetical protein